MLDLHNHLGALRRPRLLIRAARFGLSDYRRTPALRRILAAAGARSAAQVVTVLLAREAECDARRRSGDAGYSIARHVELLIALMAESRLLPGPRAVAGDDPVGGAVAGPNGAPAQPKASGISALRRATNASNASFTPGSRLGAS